MGSFGPKLSCRLQNIDEMDDTRSTSKHCGNVDPWLCYHRRSELYNFSPGRLQHGFFLSGLDANKVTPHHFSLKLEFARQRYIYDLLQTFIVHYIKKTITIFSIYHTTPKILFYTDHYITITCINL